MSEEETVKSLEDYTAGINENRWTVRDLRSGEFIGCNNYHQCMVGEKSCGEQDIIGIHDLRSHDIYAY